MWAVEALHPDTHSLSRSSNSDRDNASGALPEDRIPPSSSTLTERLGHVSPIRSTTKAITPWTVPQLDVQSEPSEAASTSPFFQSPAALLAAVIVPKVKLSDKRRRRQPMLGGEISPMVYTFRAQLLTASGEHVGMTKEHRNIRIAHFLIPAMDPPMLCKFQCIMPVDDFLSSDPEQTRGGGRRVDPSTFVPERSETPDFPHQTDRRVMVVNEEGIPWLVAPPNVSSTSRIVRKVPRIKPAGENADTFAAPLPSSAESNDDGESPPLDRSENGPASQIAHPSPSIEQVADRDRMNAVQPQVKPNGTEVHDIDVSPIPPVLPRIVPAVPPFTGHASIPSSIRGDNGLLQDEDSETHHRPADPAVRGTSFDASSDVWIPPSLRTMLFPRNAFPASASLPSVPSFAVQDPRLSSPSVSLQYPATTTYGGHSQIRGGTHPRPPLFGQQLGPSDRQTSTDPRIRMSKMLKGSPGPSRGAIKPSITRKPNSADILFSGNLSEVLQASVATPPPRRHICTVSGR